MFAKKKKVREELFETNNSIDNETESNIGENCSEDSTINSDRISEIGFDDYLSDEETTEEAGIDEDYEPWAKDPQGIEIAERLLEVSKNLIGSIDPVMNNADFKNELANMFVCMKYLQIQRLGLKERCPNIYDIESEIRMITKQNFMNDMAYNIDIAVAAMNLNHGDELADEENLELIFSTIGKARVSQLKAAKAAK